MAQRGLALLFVFLLAAGCADSSRPVTVKNFRGTIERDGPSENPWQEPFDVPAGSRNLTVALDVEPTGPGYALLERSIEGGSEDVAVYWFEPPMRHRNDRWHVASEPEAGTYEIILMLEQGRLTFDVGVRFEPALRGPETSTPS